MDSASQDRRKGAAWGVCAKAGGPGSRFPSERQEIGTLVPDGG